MTTVAVVTEAQHRYEPWGSARELMECRLPQVLLSGPAGTGKSRACLEKLHLMALANPGMRGLIVRKTRESLGSTALVTWREHVAKEAIAAGFMSFYGGSAEEPPQYRYANGSKVMIGGMDKPTKIMSSEYDVAYVQEAIELTTTDWENITTRLRNGKVGFQQLIADANPDHPTHWLKQHCDRGTARMVHCRHEDNPVLFHADGTLTVKGEAYMKLLDALTGVRLQRLRHGRWVSAEGMIYENFDPAVHMVDQFPIPDSWTRWWSVDFGFTNPFVLQCWAEDPDGRLYLYREIYKTKTLVEDHARAILREVTKCTNCCDSTAETHDCYDCEQCGKTWTEPKPRAVICDHDAEDRATLERHLGLSTTPAHKSVSDGVQAVNARYKVAGDGKARLFIMRDAVVERDEALDGAKKPCSTEEEIPGYVWDRGTPSQQLADRPPKEVPVKVNDHGCDAKRYMVAEVDLGGRPNIRWL